MGDEEKKPPVDDEENDITIIGLTKEERTRRRLLKKPSLQHLLSGVHTNPDGTKVALFDVGDRIVVERRIVFEEDHPWLDTKTYRVVKIYDDNGLLSCTDEEAGHRSWLSFTDGHHDIYLCPPKGNPFRASK